MTSYSPGPSSTNASSRLDGRRVSPSRDRLALGPWQRAIVGVAEGDDVAGDPAPRRSDDRLEGIGDDDGVLAAKPDAGPPVPGDFHRPDSDTAPCIDAYVRAEGTMGEIAPRS